MAKERNFNPVQAQRKADKAKAVKKGKSEAQTRRNEKLARKNPDRIQKQIDDLKAATTNGGKLSRHEEQVLEGLEKELRGVKKARETLGDNAPSFSRSYGGRDASSFGGVLGKRRRDADDLSSDGEDVPEDVRKIPMPRDTPPPIPKEMMDAWYAKRRARRQSEWRENHPGEEITEGKTEGKASATPAAPAAAEARTVYEAKPVVRNLQKEAVSAFVPSAVRTKLDKGRGQGGLMEPEEADRLEKEGYLKAGGEEEGDQPAGPKRVTIEDVAEGEET